jgi:hypothetical protein
MPSKIGALIRCYAITDYLPAILKNYAWVDKIVVMNYRFNSAEAREDKTSEIVALFSHPQKFLDQGEGLTQHAILNKGLEHLKDCDIAFISDADEFMTQVAMRDIADRMIAEEKDLGYSRIIDYAFDFHHRFNNRHLGGALVACNPNKTQFVKIRQTRDKTSIILFDHKLHHFGFVLPKKTMDWKLKWESKEEGLDIVKGITETQIVLSEPPEPEILQLLNEL